MALALSRRPRCISLLLLLTVLISLVVVGSIPKGRHILRMNYNYYMSKGGPPKYIELRQWEAALPQHNLSLPLPEGQAGRYVKFRNEIRGLGWNNCFNERLMNAHLAYLAGRAYVFQDYYWASEHYPWPPEQRITVGGPRTPLNAIVSGPVAGGPLDPDDTSPRAVSADWFDIVCPQPVRRYINTRDVKPSLKDASGIAILSRWQTLLRDAPERCIEIVAARPEEDSFPQTFDLGLWGSPRILTLWDSFSQSPISRLLEPSPIVRAAVDGNGYLFIPRGPRPPHPTPRDPFQRMLALHLRRGDYEGHCGWLSYLNSRFYGWSQFPNLPDRLVLEPDAPGKDERFMARCLPDHQTLVQKAADVRRDYLRHSAQVNGTRTSATLDIIYIATNEKGRWMRGLRKALQLDGWTVTTSRDLVLDTEEFEVSMAVDMEILRRAAVFLGNGWSSFTSNIVYQRLLDKRDPLTIRFT
ncbi:hypothetical protein C8R47DRAFT_1221491 [Mycena vitilis]|nr:hypothetical protein C8R47DRAFT_1221491 [Mycena vitilis]